MSVKKNDSGELGDGRADNLITGKVVEITQLQTKLEDMKPVAVDSPYMMLVGIDDLGDGSSRKFGTEGVVGTPKSAKVETKLEHDTTGPTKEAVDSLDMVLLKKDEFQEPDNRYPPPPLAQTYLSHKI